MFLLQHVPYKSKNWAHIMIRKVCRNVVTLRDCLVALAFLIKTFKGEWMCAPQISPFAILLVLKHFLINPWYHLSGYSQTFPARSNDFSFITWPPSSSAFLDNTAHWCWFIPGYSLFLPSLYQSNMKVTENNNFSHVLLQYYMKSEASLSLTYYLEIWILTSLTAWFILPS